jgi:hypothetical protein
MRLVQAGDGLQQDRLARSGGTEHNEVLSGGDVEIDLTQMEFLQVDP